MRTFLRWSWGILLLTVFMPCGATETASTFEQALRFYRNDDLKFQLKVPKHWIEIDSNSMVGFRRLKHGPSAAIGVLRRAEKNLSIGEAARRDYMAWEHPKDWSQHLMKVGDHPAMEVEATVEEADRSPGRPSPGGPQHLNVYYVEAYEGYFVIECLAPANQWPQQKALFKTIVQSFDIL